MDNMILVDLETGSFEVESGIFEVGLMVIKDSEIVERLHLGDIEDLSLIKVGKGKGYKECSNNEGFICEFKKIIDKYKFPLVAHNAPFDRKFLVYYEWIEKDYPFYDSIRAIKAAMPNLKSYSIEALVNHLEIDNKYLHTADEDVEVLWNVIRKVKPEEWFQLGEATKSERKSKYEKLDALKQEFEVVKDVFHGQTIVFTGNGPWERNKLIQIVKQLGGEAKNSITKKTNILVVGEEAGKTKLQKAEELGIEIVDMFDFLTTIKEGLK